MSHAWMDVCTKEFFFVASNHKPNVNHHCQVGQVLLGN